MAAHENLSPQFSKHLPAGTDLYHGTRQPDAIRAEGIRPSSMGESGPGVYTTPEPSEAYSHERTVLNFKTTQDLHLLDRTTPEGEDRFRELHGGYTGEGPERTRQNLAEAGYQGVHYPTRLRGKDATEVVVHDPAHLRLED